MTNPISRLMNGASNSWKGTRKSARYAIVIAVVAIAAASLVLTRPSQTRAVAIFNDSTGIYVGDSVDVLGVPVGAIDSISPQADGVHIGFHYRSSLKLPAGARAIIVAPSLVSGRYLQLTPQYAGGRVLASGAIIPLASTATPVEWDRIKSELDQLAQGLGPNGANKNGSLSRLIESTSAGLKGEGQPINQTIADLASAISTLNDGSGDLFGTIKNLETFVSALNESDGQIQAFTANLAGVSQILANDHTGLKQVLTDLATTTGKVQNFVKNNHALVTTTVNNLTGLMSILQGSEGDLAQTLHVAPQAINDLFRAYNSGTNSVQANLDLASITNAAQLVCGAIGGAGVLNPAQAYATCNSLLGPVLSLLHSGPNGGILGTLTSLGGVKLP